MERSFNQLENQEQKGESQEQIERTVGSHLNKIVEEAEKNPIYTQGEVEKAWQKRVWKIGESEVVALGVLHVPETLVYYLKDIDEAIKESSIVLTEFAPEALGIYDSSTKEKLENIKSVFNPNYNLEELRQIYLKKERISGMGVFHHAIELIAAKYGKPIAIDDLTWSRDQVDFFQNSYLYARWAEEIKKREAETNQLIASTAGTVLAGTALFDFFNNFLKYFLNKEESSMSQEESSMSRREFLKKAAIVGAGAAIASLGPKIFKSPPEMAEEKSTEGQTLESLIEEQRIQILRDAKIADTLEQLSKKYEKIVIIYGSAHLDRIEYFLNNPEERRSVLEEGRGLIEKYNPDSFRIYTLQDGQNTSDESIPVASKNIVWKCVSKNLN